MIGFLLGVGVGLLLALVVASVALALAQRAGARGTTSADRWLDLPFPASERAMTMTERISRLELLHRVCRRKGWALCLRSSGDGHAFGTTARLTALDVVELTAGDGQTRRRRIVAGDLIGRRILASGSYRDREDAAEALLDQMRAYGMLDDLRDEAA